MLTLPKLKKKLNELSEEEKIALIIELYKTNKQVKDYINVRYDEKYALELADKYIKKLDKTFNVDNPGRSKIMDTIKIFKEMAVSCNNNEAICKVGINYLNSLMDMIDYYGFYHQSMYSWIEFVMDKTYEYVGNNQELINQRTAMMKRYLSNEFVFEDWMLELHLQDVDIL